MLIYIARALEWMRINWNTFWLFTVDRRRPFGMFSGPLIDYGKPGAADYDGRFRVPFSFVEGRIYNRAGAIVIGVCEWMYPLAVRLTRVANRGLPRLPESAGFLARLYGRNS